MIRHSRYHQIDTSIMYGLAVLTVLILSGSHKVSFQLQKVNVPFRENVGSSSIFKQEAFSDVHIKGKSYVVYDIVSQKIIAEKNADIVLPLASITKIMTLVTARTHYSGKKQITITPLSIDGSYDLGLRKGQVFDLDELLKYTLIFSSNDGAQAIADGLGGRSVFVSQMNSDAAKLGLLFNFTHPAGLDENGKIGGEGSALSVAKLVTIALRDFPEILEATTKTRANVLSSTGRITGVPNTNQEVANLSGIEASKTGFTDLAGGNLVIVVDVSVGHPVAIVVLGSTHEDRFSDVDVLYKALKKSIVN